MYVSVSYKRKKQQEFKLEEAEKEGSGQQRSFKD